MAATKGLMVLLAAYYPETAGATPGLHIPDLHVTFHPLAPRPHHTQVMIHPGILAR